MRHIFSVFLENQPGALSRVAGLFSARGYNIESLTVAPTNDDTLSRMTIVTVGDDRKIDQIEKHLNKLVDVVSLQNIVLSSHLEREVVLVKLAIDPSKKSEIVDVVKDFNGNLYSSGENLYIVEMSGSSETVDELIESLSSAYIIEIARSGVTGLSSGDQALDGALKI